MKFEPIPLCQNPGSNFTFRVTNLKNDRPIDWKNPDGSSNYFSGSNPNSSLDYESLEHIDFNSIIAG